MSIIFLVFYFLPANADQNSTPKPNLQTITKPTLKPAEVIVNPEIGQARHAVSSTGFSDIQAHYLLEHHVSTIHLIYRPPNKNEVYHGVEWAGEDCPGKDQRTAKIEEYEADVLSELFGGETLNIKNLPEHLSPSLGNYPNLVVDKYLKQRKTPQFGLLQTPKEIAQKRSGRSFPVVGQQAKESIRTTSTSTTSTTPEWNYNEYEDDMEETTMAPITSEAKFSAAKPIPKPTTKPNTTTQMYQKPVADEDFNVRRFSVQGEELIFYGISSRQYEKAVREATLLLMFAKRDELFQAIKNFQSMHQDYTPAKTWFTNSQPLNTLKANEYSPKATPDLTYIVTEAIPGRKYTVIDSKNVLEISVFPRFFGKSRFTRLQLIIESFETCPEFYWASSDESESNPIPMPLQSFTYTQNEHSGYVGGTKICTRQEPRSSKAYCRTVSHGINFGHTSMVDIQILLSKHSNIIFLTQAAVVWESTKNPVLTPEDSLEIEDERHRNRRQVGLLLGLGGAAGVMVAEAWNKFHDKKGENYKDLQQHLVDLGQNLDKAIRDEDEKTLNLDAHITHVETQEWILYCAAQTLTRTQLKEYFVEKAMRMVESAQLLGSKLKTNPMDSSLKDTIKKICEAHNPEDKAICLKGAVTAEMTNLSHHGMTIIAEIQIKTPVTELEYRNCKLFEEVSLPKLTYMEDKKLTKVEELDIPKRIRIQCGDSSFFFDSKGASLLDDKNILLELIESSATLECDTDYMSCPVEQFATRSTCQRKIYSTINGKEYVAISSTDPISDSDFTTLHSLGLHAKTRRKDEEAALNVKVFPRHPKRNIHIRCGHELEKEYHLHQSQTPDDVTIVHLEKTDDIEASNTLIDVLDKQMKDLQKDQQNSKAKAFGDKFRMTMDLLKLNQSLDQIAEIKTPLGNFGIDNKYMWIAVIIIALLVIIGIIICRIRQFCIRRAEAAAMTRNATLRMSKINRRRTTSA